MRDLMIALGLYSNANNFQSRLNFCSIDPISTIYIYDIHPLL